MRRLLLVRRVAALAALVLAVLAAPQPAGAAEYVQNFTATELWSGPDSGAISFGTAPQWDYFQVVSRQPNGRLYVLVLRTQNFAFIDAKVVGPAGPPPAGWPNLPPRPPLAEAGPASQAIPATQALVGPIPGYNLLADGVFWPALQILDQLRHSWTLTALSSTGTRLEWGAMTSEAAGYYQPSRGMIVINSRWQQADPRALAAIIEHEAKHVADVLAGVDVTSPSGCLQTEINAFREEAKTWAKLVGPRGKRDPRDELELSLNYKLALYQRNPEDIDALISENPGYRLQCRL